LGSLAVLGSVSLLQAREPVWVPIETGFQLTTAAQPAQPVQPAPEPEPPPDLLTQGEAQGPSGSSNPGSGHSQMIGDLNGGIFIRRAMTFPTLVRLQATTTNSATGAMSTEYFTEHSTIRREVNVPLAARGPFKIGENESAMPMTRAYTTYNYFNNIAVLPGRPGIPPLVNEVLSGRFNSVVPVTQTMILPGSEPPITGEPPPPVTVTTTSFDVTTVHVLGFDPAPPPRRLDVHREVFGFEQALLDGNFSVGVRLPLIQQTGDSSLEGSHIGDVDLIFKYALINDQDSGNVLSAGLMVTAPTGESDIAVDGSKIHPALLQPFVGYFANLGDFYVQGFSSLVVPTDSRDATLLCNDVGIGYRAYRGDSDSGLIRYINPTIEGHFTTPLDNHGAHESPAGFPDISVVTAGVHIGLGDRASLTVGASTPLTGPQPFDGEGVVQFNFRF
jgi:hypothetical protein